MLECFGKISDGPSEVAPKLKRVQCPAVYIYSVFISLCERHGTKTQGATDRLESRCRLQSDEFHLCCFKYCHLPFFIVHHFALLNFPVGKSSYIFPQQAH